MESATVSRIATGHRCWRAGRRWFEHSRSILMILFPAEGTERHISVYGATTDWFTRDLVPVMP